MVRPTGDRAAWVLAVGILDFSLEQTIIIPALPAVQARYGASTAQLAWFLTGFLLALAVVTPVAGRLGDRHGHRRVLLFSLAAFAGGSAICALAPSIEVLIAGRLVQGLGAGVGPLAIALVRAHVEPARLPRAIGLQIGAGGAGGVVGFLAGGLLTDHVGLEAVFWALFAVAAALALAVMAWVPESSARSPARVDWIGAALLAGSLAGAMLAASEGGGWGWTSGRTLSAIGAAIALAAAFAVREATAAEPLIDRRALARRSVWSADLVVLAVGLSLFSAYFLVPLIGGAPRSTGYGLGLTITEIALVLTPGAFGALLGGPASARLVARLGARATVALGALCAGSGHLLLLVLDPTMAGMTVAMIPIGFGIGLTLGALVAVVALSVDGAETGVNVGLNSVLRAIGTAIGVQIAAAILDGGDRLASGLPTEGAFDGPFLAAALASVLVILLVSALPPRGADPVLAVAGAPPRQPSASA